jgi:hypothetical protein
MTVRVGSTVLGEEGSMTKRKKEKNLEGLRLSTICSGDGIPHFVTPMRTRYFVWLVVRRVTGVGLRAGFIELFVGLPDHG